MADVFVGQIACFGFNFAPRNWAQCNGQLMSIAQNTALFSLLGTQFGGNGFSNFALPNLNGSVLGAQGQGPGLSSRVMGEQTGAANVSLLSTELPAHSHTLSLSAGAANTHAVPATGDVLVDSGINAFLPVATSPLSTQLASTSVGGAGGSQPHNNNQPVLVMNWCIALQGVFPARP